MQWETLKWHQGLYLPQFYKKNLTFSSKEFLQKDPFEKSRFYGDKTDIKNCLEEKVILPKYFGLCLRFPLLLIIKAPEMTCVVRESSDHSTL